MFTVQPESRFPADIDDTLSRTDRLFRSAVTEFCARARPTRYDAARLDDLTLPLLPLVSESTRRFAAAALSEALPAPDALLRRLAAEPLAVSAPILLRSPAIGDVDLIGLIGRHGIEHAGAIARRPRLNPNIRALIRALGIAGSSEGAGSDAALSSAPDAQIAEQTRERLRAMMRPAEPAAAQPLPTVTPIDWDVAAAAWPRLVSTGMSGRAALFITAIADAFSMDFEHARHLVDGDDGAMLATALKAAGFSTPEAFLVAALAAPPRFATTEGIRGFLARYRSLEDDEARTRLAKWRDRAAGSAPVAETSEAGIVETRVAANQTGGKTGFEVLTNLLKAS